VLVVLVMALAVMMSWVIDDSVCVCVCVRMRMRMRLQSVFLQSAYLRSVCFVRVQLSVPSPFSL